MTQTFSIVYKNIDKIKVELNIMSSLIGSKNMEYDFDLLFNKYPEIRKYLPLLIAVREKEIKVIDNGKN
ncbi:DpnII family type II restriction endonuclease [Campylobacter devanensis]|uniref:DpnII family type II restriction endonuclease n=1 Tax=Campylobacter devanensis TaxID=3161138 RepID=UPI000A35AF9D